MRQESLNGLHTIEFLKHLIRHVGPRLLVIWDGSPIHRRAAVKEFLATTAARGVRVELLPAYAPDLNPVEWAWQHLKHVEMRNLITLDLEELHLELHLAIGRLRQKSRVIRSFFVGAGLESEDFPSLLHFPRVPPSYAASLSSRSAAASISTWVIPGRRIPHNSSRSNSRRQALRLSA